MKCRYVAIALLLATVFFLGAVNFSISKDFDLIGCNSAEGRDVRIDMQASGAGERVFIQGSPYDVVIHENVAGQRKSLEIESIRFLVDGKEYKERRGINVADYFAEMGVVVKGVDLVWRDQVVELRGVKWRAECRINKRLNYRIALDWFDRIMSV